MINKYTTFTADFLPAVTKVSSPLRKVSTTTSTSFLDAMRTVMQTRESTPVVQVRPVATEETLRISLKKDVKLSVPNLIQGHNECGPTSLAMMEQYFGIDPGNYHEMFPSDSFGHGPLALKEKAEAKGLTVRQENYGSLEDLRALVDMGVPTMVLGIYGGGANSTISDYIENAPRAHWMTVTGYKTDDLGKITHIYLRNPNQNKLYDTDRANPDTDHMQCWTASDFLNKFWNNNIIPGGHRYYMATAPRNNERWRFQESALKRYLPQDKISESFRITLSLVDGLEEAAYGLASIWDEISSWFS